jgi:hypothetical protein
VAYFYLKNGWRADVGYEFVTVLATAGDRFCCDAPYFIAVMWAAVFEFKR